MKIFLVAALVAGCQAAPQFLYSPLVYHALPTTLTATGNSVPVAIGGYKAVAGEGGAVHEVPGLFGAPAVLKQESEGGISLSTGTGAYHVIGKRDADPALLAGYPYLGYGLHYPYGVVATAGSGSP